MEGKAKGKTIEDFFGKKEAKSHEISDEEEDKGSNSSHEGKEESPQKGIYEQHYEKALHVLWNF